MKPPTPSRRALIVGAGVSLLPLRSGIAAGLVATPAQTEGPFYPTAFPADMDNDLVQVRGQAAQAMGTILHLEGRVLDLNGRPVDGALVEIWQCDAQGLYDHPRQPGRERRDSAFQGYGRMLVRADGSYSFRDAEAGRLSRPHAAHPLQGRDGIGRPADQPVLHCRRARQRARRRLSRRHPRSAPARTHRDAAVAGARPRSRCAGHHDGYCRRLRPTCGPLDGLA